MDKCLINENILYKRRFFNKKNAIFLKANWNIFEKQRKK